MPNNHQTALNAYRLKQLKERNVVVSLFIDPDNTESFMACYIRAVNDRQVLVEQIDPWGRYDGWMTMKLDQILMILSDDEYEIRLQELLQIRRCQPQPSLQITNPLNLFAPLLESAARHRSALTLWSAQEALTGYVLRYDDLYVEMLPLSFMGECLSAKTLKMNELQMASLDSDEEKMYDLLNKNTHRPSSFRNASTKLTNL